MTRRDFTLLIADQILYTGKLLERLGMAVQLDWVLRSVYDQQQMFKTGKSKCDGLKIVSAHQKGKAADLLVIGPNNAGTLDLIDPLISINSTWKQIRQHWEDLGGKKMIEWDPAHFETR